MKKFKYYTPLVLQKIGYILFGLAYKFFVRLEVCGSENLSGIAGPIILASNHTSELDVTAIPLILPFFSKIFPIYFVSNPTDKYKNFGWRSYIYGGIFFNMLGGYAVYSGHKDYATSLENHIFLLRQGRAVCIFPEGKRTRDGKMNPARGGLGYLVYSTGATVVPVTIDTFFNISIVDFLLRRKKVTITVDKPILPDEIISPAIKNPSVLDFQSSAQKVLNKIAEAIE